ncbi:MAG: MotA/TolQ/ExbB proton channel family protein [Proteobacteria bacterium]|nr:MotA/TolQ/ExbB proton channel family protein [Pseudomonadota bacterium]MBU1386438.1 MotA/TolQ/ExbB proton channel family protein [Pseudomonadota bacterium]MBU1544549.1 MotA/TolQ/ExbB proton channel family protein [Pseudomonadota bacterium]MBU2480999.1 MotA/TolQ/ExbB proton channel family protein [Pseudomonadota bacterium]
MVLIFFCLMPFSAMGQDIRENHLFLKNKQQEMEQKARAQLLEARAEAEEKKLKIINDEKTLTAAIADLKNRNKDLKIKVKQIEENILGLKEIQAKLKDDLSESHAANREISGFIRGNAKDLQDLLAQSLQSALIKNRETFLEDILHEERFWSMDDIEKMTDSLFEEIKASGQVKFSKTDIIDRQGREQEATVLTLGNFTGIYVLETGSKKEIGFLIYSDQSRRFFALSRLPSSRMTARIDDYIQGKSIAVPLDISKGGALRQFTHKLNLLEQVPKGGPIIWPILAIFGLALIILLERLFFFFTKKIQVEPFMAKLRGFVAQENWEECDRLLRSQKKCLIPKVLLTALPFREHSRQDMENALQEAILGEIPGIERFVSTLGMLAAIAPLMGLLGTVTGMINTFHVITYHGAGDPRMMSGGISEALVTTMLGLSVAIPIMLSHTLLNRRVETQIGLMEEKSVAFVNMVFKTRNGSR